MSISPLSESDRVSPESPPEQWVPVDRRWHGLDRRTLKPALIVLGWAVAVVLVVPALGGLFSADSPARPGDVIGLAGDVTFVPANGWTITEGVLVADRPLSGFPDSAAVTQDGVVFEVETADYDGTAAQLLEQIKTTDTGAQIDGPTTAVTTTSGERGVLARYRSQTTDGLIAAFVIDGTGVEVELTGPTDVSTHPEQQIVAMLTSISQG